MAKHRTYTENDLRYLKMLARMFPTVRAAATEIINLNAIMNLPKGCEHFISDVHGEHEAFLHILNSCSGVIRERLDELFANVVSRDELNQLAQCVNRSKLRLSTDEEMVALHQIFVAILRDCANRLYVLDVSAAVLKSDFDRKIEIIKYGALL